MGFLKGMKLVTDLGYEFVESNFKPLERLRNVEFTRDWGLPLVVLPRDETIFTAGTQLADVKNNSLRYQFTDITGAMIQWGLRNSLTHVQTLRDGD